jgi:glyoxylase-like metal-dependent hydrolase (beta-lactamase superfamily II)
MIITLLVACNVSPIQNGATFGPLTQVKETFTSAFVGRTEAGTTVLFDTGVNARGAPLERALEGLGATLEDPTALFVTHGHGDHVAAVGAFPAATVHAIEAERDLLAEEDVAIEVPLADGQSVAVDEWIVETFHVPGHTAGNAVYLVSGVLVMGDTALLDAKGAVVPAPDNYSDDPALAASNLRALRDRLLPRRDEITHVVFAHSDGLADPGAFFDM